jgi:hypothetical protein
MPKNRERESRALKIPETMRRYQQKRMLLMGQGGVRLGLLSAVTMSLASLILGGSGLKIAADGNASSEYQVKAAFLFHFAQFVDWPAEAFKGADSPLTYCTLGEDPFHGALDATLNGKTVGARAFRVRHFKQVQELQECQVLFVGAGEKKAVLSALDVAKRGPVLTVGEAEHFVQDGGMIEFFLEDNKVRFNINLDAAERAKLKISARLLALAKTVTGGPKGT